MPRRVGYAVRQMRSGLWQVRVRNAAEKLVGVGTFADKEAAEIAGQEAAAQVRRGMWVDPSVSDIDLEVYLHDWLRRRQRTGRHGERYAEDAARMVRLHIGPYIGRRALTDLTPAGVAAWHDELVAARLAATGAVGLVPAKAYRLLHAALEDAVRDQLLVRNPCMIASAGVERSTERPLLEVDQVLELADAVPDRWRAMVLTAAFCGLRLGELAGLRRGDVDLLHGRLTVSQAVSELSSGRLLTKPPKTTAGRRAVAVPKPLAPVLDEHLSMWVGVEADALVFTAPRGGPLRRSNFSDDWRRAVRAAGLDGVHFHDLRHFAGTLAAQHGATERELQARLGHASNAAARRYLHAAERRDAELADRIGASMGDTLRGKQRVPPVEPVAHPWRK